MVFANPAFGVDVRTAVACGFLALLALGPSTGAAQITTGGHWDFSVGGGDVVSDPIAGTSYNRTTTSGGVQGSAFVGATTQLRAETAVIGPVAAATRLAAQTSFPFRLYFPAGAAVAGGKLVFHVVLDGTLSGNATLALGTSIQAQEASAEGDLSTRTGNGTITIDDPAAGSQVRELDVLVDLLASLWTYSPTSPLQGTVRLGLGAFATMAATGLQGTSAGVKAIAEVVGFRVLNAAGVQVTGFTMGFGGVPGVAVPELAAGQATAVEFYNEKLDHYFLTHVAGEIANLDGEVTIKGWRRTGASFPVYTAARSGSSPVCRFRIPPDKGDSHFYGRGTAECDATARNYPTFVNEDPQFFHTYLPIEGVCPSGTREVYRVFSDRADANHRYMIDAALRDQMVAKGWKAEGDGPNQVVMCMPA